MNNTEFEQAIQIALRTWYPIEHELHLNPHHPLGKLLGEWGELLDDYMKGLYKPGYQFEPENELGDIWYYLRILCYQQSYIPTLSYDNNVTFRETEYIITESLLMLSKIFLRPNFIYDKIGFDNYGLDHSYTVLFKICNQHNITLHQLTKSNWEKLKPGSERGDQWMRAR